MDGRSVLAWVPSAVGFAADRTTFIVEEYKTQLAQVVRSTRTIRAERGKIDKEIQVLTVTDRYTDTHAEDTRLAQSKQTVN